MPRLNVRSEVLQNVHTRWSYCLGLYCRKQVENGATNCYWSEPNGCPLCLLSSAHESRSNAEEYRSNAREHRSIAYVGPRSIYIEAASSLERLGKRRCRWPDSGCRR